MEQQVSEDILDSLSPFLSPYATKNSIIFCNYCGSKAYNLANEESDDDLYAIYVVPLK